MPPKASANGIILLGFIDLLVYAWAILMFITPLPVFLVLFLSLLIISFGIAALLIMTYNRNIDHNPDLLNHMIKILRIVSAFLVGLGLIGFILLISQPYIQFILASIILSLIEIGIIIGMYSFLFSPKINKPGIVESKRTAARKVAEKNFWVISGVMFFAALLMLVFLGSIAATGALGMFQFLMCFMGVLVLLGVFILVIGEKLGIIHIKKEVSATKSLDQ